jgi:peptidoglycan glycosyltransferase
VTRELNRVTAAVLAAFLVIALSAAFWAVIQGDSLLARSDNARNVIEEQRIRRGAIIDRDGERLAYSVENPDGTARRVYPYPVAAGAVGYYSFTYGTAGIEAAYDDQLRGDPWHDDWQAFVDHTLHRAQQGGDVRTTLDLDVQQAAAAALGHQSGAVIVVEVPSGRVLAMVSQPGYDPNQIDTDWDLLTQDEATSPLLNRVTMGLYQPGGALETVILSAILATNPDLKTSGEAILNAEAPDARAPVQVNGLTLTCLDGVPEEGTLTLAEAYVYGCPAPFANATRGALTPDQVWDRLDLLGLLDAPTLVGFETAASRRRWRLTVTTPPDVLAAALVGQGDLAITPLHMAQVVAAVANRGNAVPFYLVDAIRAPDAKTWQPVKIPAEQPAVLRADVAAVLRLAMLHAAAQSPYVSRARRGDLVLYGHSAVAYGGSPTTPYAWFLGFVDQTEGDIMAAIVAVVVVENESDPGVAAHVAGEAFAAAAQD